MTRDFLYVLNASFSITPVPRLKRICSHDLGLAPRYLASRCTQMLLCLRYFSRFGFCNFQSSQTHGSSVFVAVISIRPPPSLEGGLGRELARDEGTIIHIKQLIRMDVSKLINKGIHNLFAIKLSQRARYAVIVDVILLRI